MVKRGRGMSVVVGCLLASGVSHAEDVPGGYVAELENYWGMSKASSWSQAQLDSISLQPGICKKTIAKNKTSKPADKAVGNFEGHANAKPAGSKFEIAWSDAPGICDAFEAQRKLQTSMAPIAKAVDIMKDKKGPPTAADAKGFNSGAGDSTVSAGKDCLKNLGGIAGTTKLKLGGKEMTVDETKQVCQAAIDYGTAFNAFINEEQKAKRAEAAKKYEAVGIAGAKLALMIEYDGVYWRNTKCEKTDDVAELAKAKVLLQWLENSNGTHTIRRYTFKGNKVASKTDKTFKKEAQAQKACK